MGGNTAIVVQWRVIFKLGKWTLYDVTGTRKKYKLLLNYPIKTELNNLYRITDNLFYGVSKDEA